MITPASLLQWPAVLVGSVTVATTVALSVLGLVVVRRFVAQNRMQNVSDASEHIFTLAGVLYAVLVAFVVVVAWEQFDAAQTATESEATAISDLLRDADGLPVAARTVVRKALTDYTNDVLDDELPRLRRGDSVEAQSPHVTELWQAYQSVEPVSRSEIAFYDESIHRLDDLGTARQTRIAGGQAEIPSEMWVLLLGGGALMLAFTYLFSTADLVLHGVLIALAGALMAFVLYLIFALSHPFLGSLSVPSDPYHHVLQASVPVHQPH